MAPPHQVTKPMKKRTELEDFQFERSISKGEMKKIRKNYDADQRRGWKGKADTFTLRARLYVHELIMLNELRKEQGNPHLVKVPGVTKESHQHMAAAFIEAKKFVEEHTSKVKELEDVLMRYGMSAEEGTTKDALKEWLKECNQHLYKAGLHLNI